MTQAIDFLSNWQHMLENFKYARRTTATLKYQTAQGQDHIYALSKKPEQIQAITLENTDSLLMKALINILDEHLPVNFVDLKVEIHLGYDATLGATCARQWQLKDGELISTDNYF